MMGSEKDVHVVGVEHLRKLLVHCIKVHFWGERKSFHEEHGVLKFLNIWLVSSFPDYFHDLLEGAWDETTVWNNFARDRGRGVDEESNWALLTWV